MSRSIELSITIEVEDESTQTAGDFIAALYDLASFDTMPPFEMIDINDMGEED